METFYELFRTPVLSNASQTIKRPCSSTPPPHTHTHTHIHTHTHTRARARAWAHAVTCKGIHAIYALRKRPTVLDKVFCWVCRRDRHGKLRISFKLRRWFHIDRTRNSVTVMFWSTTAQILSAKHHIWLGTYCIYFLLCVLWHCNEVSFTKSSIKGWGSSIRTTVEQS